MCGFYRERNSNLIRTDIRQDFRRKFIYDKINFSIVEIVYFPQRGVKYGMLHGKQSVILNGQLKIIILSVSMVKLNFALHSYDIGF